MFILMKMNVSTGDMMGDVCEITAWGAKVRTLVIATDEELMIARDTKEVIEK